MADENEIEIHEAESGAQETPETTSGSTRDWKSMGMIALKWMRVNLLFVLTLSAVILGVFFGGVFRSAYPSSTAITLIGLPGDVLVRLLKLLVLPLIVSSLITGLTSLDTKSCGKLAARALVYYFTTSCIAVIIGIIVVVTIRPGSRAVGRIDIDLAQRDDSSVNALNSFVDILRNLFPSNLVQACFQQAKSFYKYEDVWKLVPNVTVDPGTVDPARCYWENATETGICHEVKIGMKTDVTKGFKDGINLVGILVFTIPFGVLLSRMGERGRVMVEFFKILSEITMQLVDIVMWYSPLGIMSLICAKVLSMKSLAETIPILGLYMLTVVLGLLIHLAILMTIYYASTRKNPLTFFRGILQAWLTAFATASKLATLPVTFRCLEENLKVDKKVTRFILPIGLTVNMDGTALYEVVAIIFIGQLNGIPIGFGKIITISLTATLCSIGAAIIPSGGIVTLILVLTAVGFPLEDISLLLAVDWFLDRCRTSINVVGDSYGAGIVYHLSKKELDALDKEEEAELEQEAGHEAEDGDVIHSGKAEIEVLKVLEDVDKNEGAKCESSV